MSNFIEKTSAGTSSNTAFKPVPLFGPPVLAASNTAEAALHAENSADGIGALGRSAKGDGVHGETSGANMSGVAGIHNAGGNGVYGKSSGGNAGNFDGNVLVNGNLTVTGDVYLPGADCAEQFDCVGSNIVAGSVVVIDETGRLSESQNAYDRRVVGVVAGAGTYRPALILDKIPSEAPRVSVSLIGKAYCKADARYGRIGVGDLLTTSPTPGSAMRADDAAQSFGAVVGKALRPLESGEGLIPIIIALQ